MEVVGGTAAAAQILVYGFKTVDHLRDLKSKIERAPREIRSQIQHIDGLITLVDLYNNNATVQPKIKSCLDRCLLQAQEIGNILQDLYFDDSGKFLHKAKKAISLGRAQKDLLAMFEKLERDKSSLILLVQEIDSTLLREVDSQLSIVGTDLRLTRDHVIRIESSLDHVGGNTRLLPIMAAQLADLHLSKRSVKGEATQLPKAKKYYHFPARHVSRLIGREDTLASMQTVFAQDWMEDFPIIVALTGLGGQGKTQVALEHCRCEKRNGIRGIFWIDAMSQDTVESSFRRISGILQDSKDSIRDDEWTRHALQTLESWDEPFVLVFDNYDDPSSYLIHDYLPDSKFGRILVTSRHIAAANIQPEHAIALGSLGEAHATELLLRQAGLRSSSETLKQAGNISRKLGNHALAITQAGSYIKVRQLDLCDFEAVYGKQKDSVLKHTHNMSQYRRKLGSNVKETTLSVFTTLELSLQHLVTSVSDGEARADVLTLFAFLDSKDISEQLFCLCKKMPHVSSPLNETVRDLFLDVHGTWSHQQYEDFVVGLHEKSLAEAWYRDKSGSCHLTLHPLVRDWLCLRLSDDQFQQFSTYAMLISAHGLKSTISEQGVWHNSLAVNERQMFFAHIKAHHDNVIHLESNMSAAEFNKLYGKFHWAEEWFSWFLIHESEQGLANSMATRVVDWRSKCFGKTDKRTTDAIYMLAIAYFASRKYTDATPRLFWVFNCWAERLGPYHPKTLAALAYLVATLESLDHDLHGPEFFHYLSQRCKILYNRTRIESAVRRILGDVDTSAEDHVFANFGTGALSRMADKLFQCDKFVLLEALPSLAHILLKDSDVDHNHAERQIETRSFFRFDQDWICPLFGSRQMIESKLNLLANIDAWGWLVHSESWDDNRFWSFLYCQGPKLLVFYQSRCLLADYEPRLEKRLFVGIEVVFVYLVKTAIPKRPREHESHLPTTTKKPRDALIYCWVANFSFLFSLLGRFPKSLT